MFPILWILRTQKRNEDAYVNMLNLLAASGKLVRISELDMGCLDSAGNTDADSESH
jgi:hypothetical protein